MNNQKWLDISHTVAQYHPVMAGKIKLLTETLDKANNAAKRSDAEGVGFAIDACKLETKLCHAIYHLGAAGVIDDETCTQFKHELEAYCTSEYETLFLEYAKCVGETETKILGVLIQRATELEPKFQELVVKLAQHIREIERAGRQGSN